MEPFLFIKCYIIVSYDNGNRMFYKYDPTDDNYYWNNWIYERFYDYSLAVPVLKEAILDNSTSVIMQLETMVSPI